MIAAFVLVIVVAAAVSLSLEVAVAVRSAFVVAAVVPVVADVYAASVVKRKGG